MSIKGYADQKKSASVNPEFATVGPVRAEQSGLDSLAHEFVQSVATDAVEAGSTTTVINATAHVARRGDIIRITSGALAPTEVAVHAVTANQITLVEALPSAPATSVAFSILRFTRPVVNSSGEIPVSLSASAVQFKRNGSNVDVTEDTVTPSNNLPLPVKLTGVTGDLSITAQNLNIQSTHTGANPDSVQVGDGTDLLAIETDGSINARLRNGSGTALDMNSGAAGAATLRTALATRHEAVATPLAAQLSNGTAAVDYASGAAGTATLRTVLATRHEAAATPVAVRLAQDGANFGAVDHGAPTTAPRTAAVIGNASGALAYNSGAAGADTLRTVLATRHETATTPVAVRIAQDGAAFAGVDHGATTGAMRTAAVIGNAAGPLAYDSGASSAATLRTVLATRHEAAATPVAFRQSNGSAFATMGAGAADSATPRVETAAADATFSAAGKINGTALTTSYATLLTTAATPATVLTLLNTCNQTIYISFNASTHHIELEDGESVVIDFGANNRRLAASTTISARALSSIPTSGSVRASVVY